MKYHELVKLKEQSLMNILEDIHEILDEIGLRNFSIGYYDYDKTLKRVERVLEQNGFTFDRYRTD